MNSCSTIYTHALRSVLFPHMYMEIPIDCIKKYHIYKERHSTDLALGIITKNKNYLLMYGCTAKIISYNTDQKKATILGLERFQKLFALHAHITKVRYVYDQNTSKEHTWVTQLKIIECLEIIGKTHDMVINLRRIKNMNATEFSYTIAASGFFNANDKYTLLAAKSARDRLELEHTLLNARFFGGKNSRARKNR